MVTGTVANGSSGATGALIEGGSVGVSISGAGTVANYGTIEATNGGVYCQVKLAGPGSINNLGAASLIEAYIGIVAQSNVTVTNAGTIASSNGALGHAIEFGDGTNSLIVDPGAV